MINHYELQVHCIGLENNATFPLENTGRGKDISPAFVLENHWRISDILSSKILHIGLYGIFRPRKTLPGQFLMGSMSLLSLMRFRELLMAGTNMPAPSPQKESSTNTVLPFMH